MWLDLKGVMDAPDEQVSFACELDTSRLTFPFLLEFTETPNAVGTVKNTAGVLTLTGDVRANMRCVCDRCGSVFEREKTGRYSAVLAADMSVEDDAEVFPITEDGIDPGDVLTTCLILDMDAKCLCREDCRGLCPRCGKNLNDGPCACTKPPDPRLAVLEQLLDKDESKI